MGRYVIVCLLSVFSGVLAGCGTVVISQGEQLAQACRAETAVPGSYDFDGRDDVPVVTPIRGNNRLVGGTAEGAAQINACIRAKAAAGQTGGSVNATNMPPPQSTAPAGGTDAFATQCLFEVTVPSGAGRQAGIDAMNACISRKAAAAGSAPAQSAASVPVAVALPNVAGVPQTQTSQTTGTRTTTTFTYGTPPGSASAAAQSANGTAPTRQCSLQMTGGTGYSCVFR
jgi:hypothetical protein